jgi:hypothetical protein
MASVCGSLRRVLWALALHGLATHAVAAGGMPPPPPPELPVVPGEDVLDDPLGVEPLSTELPDVDQAPIALPTEADLGALKARIAAADPIVAFGRDGSAQPGRFESHDRRDLESFAAALVLEPPGAPMRDLCEGSPAVDIDAGGARILRITYHHGAVVRANGWRTDIPLADAGPLVAWFEARGIAGPRREVREAEEADAAVARWYDAMPRALQPLWDDMRDASPPEAPFELAPARAALEGELPAIRDRVRALFRWLGAERGPWTGYPAYEMVAEGLVLEYPLEDLVAVAQEPDLDAASLEGAARTFACWDFWQRRGEEIDRLPPELRARLLARSLESARTGGDEDKRQRAEAAFAPSGADR